MQLNRLVFILFVALFASCTPFQKISKQNSIGSLRFINEYDYPNSHQLDGTTIGGLSGIDYDPKTSQYYFICDDPSSRGASRFYTARINLNEKGIDLDRKVLADLAMNNPETFKNLIAEVK